jgi:hypothetical protein
MDRDIILAALSCGGKMHCQKEAAEFKDPPIVIAVPGGSADGFARTAKQHRQHNSVLEAFFASRRELSAVRPRRVCLVGFADGCGWISAVLKASHDRPRIDTVLALDGLLTAGLQAWIDYASQAANGGRPAPRLWLAHSQGQTQKTNKRVFDRAKKSTGSSGPVIDLPDYIVHASLESPPVRVYSKTETPTTKLFHADTLVEYDSIGNLVRVAFSGDNIQDSIYIAQYVQPRFWRWLRHIWSDPDAGVFFQGR